MSAQAQARLKIIEEHPIGNGLEAFHAAVRQTFEGKNISGADAVDELNHEGMVLCRALGFIAAVLRLTIV